MSFKQTIVRLEEHVSEHADELYACLTIATIVVASFWRLRFGIDFTDEAFYAAITQRFTLGDLPYVDEYNLRQTASLLTVPYYWLYLKINGTTDGIVYFLRVVYFMVQLWTGWTVYRFAEKRLPRAFAILAATLPIVFLPFGIPTCSYNTLGAMFFTAGTFTGLSALIDADPEERTRPLVVSGLLHGIACVAYPPLAIPAVFFTAMTRFSSPEETARGWGAPRRHLIGLGIVATLLALPLLPGLVSHGVRAAVDYEHMTTQLRGLDKAKEVIQAAAGTYVPGGPGWLSTLGVFALVGKHYPRLRRFVLGGLVVWLAWWFQATQPAYAANLSSMYASIYVGLLAGFFLVFVAWKPIGRSLALVGWLPSVLAGFITAFATANVGCMNGGIGLFAAACLTMVVAPMAADVRPLSAVARLGAALVLSSIPLALLSVNLETTYRSGDVSTLTTDVRMGPFKGLRGTAAQAGGAEVLAYDVRQTIGPAKRMIAYYDFPAAYLAAPVRPGFPTAWTDSRAQLGKLLPYYQKHRSGEGIVLVLKGMDSFCPELEALTQSPDRLLVDNGWYQIYREPSP